MERSPHQLRVLRQHVETDRLLGITDVPVNPHDPTIPQGEAPVETPIVPDAAESAPPTVMFTVRPRADSLFAAAAPSTQHVQRLDRNVKIRLLAEMDQAEVKSCRKCQLCEARTNTVFGEGDPDASIMFVGEGPGENEDLQGRPFVGRAGELLDRMIVAMGFARSQVYIANIVKCRPPGNRTPTPIEAQTCYDYLLRQIRTIQPQALVALGAPASKTLLNTTTGITAIRGTWHNFTGLTPDGPVIPIMPTFHPAYLLRSYTEDNRRKVWDDLKKVVAYIKEHPR